MGAETKIQWCDYTFNPWEGCTKVSPGCAHCYAETRNARFGGGTAPNWGKGAPRRRTSIHNWNEPRRWDRAADAQLAAFNREVAVSFGHLDDMMEEPRRPRVFCASLADWLDDEVPIEWLADLLALIRETPHLDWLLLTKRPENWLTRMEKVTFFAMFTPAYHSLLSLLAKWHPAYDGGGGANGSPVPPANVWIGTTVEDQQRANERIPQLRRIPARVRFLSCEPMLGPLDLSRWMGPWRGCGDYLAAPTVQDRKEGRTSCARYENASGECRADFCVFGYIGGIDWVIIGGESGAGARDFHTEHAWDLVLQCCKAGVATFVKQLGTNPVTSNANAMDWEESTVFLCGTELSAASARPVLQDKKGGDPAEWPEELRVREFPK